jgi:hypothetical protein
MMRGFTRKALEYPGRLLQPIAPSLFLRESAPLAFQSQHPTLRSRLHQQGLAPGAHDALAPGDADPHPDVCPRRETGQDGFTAGENPGWFPIAFCVGIAGVNKIHVNLAISGGVLDPASLLID